MYKFINSSAALPHFYCSYSLSGGAFLIPPSNLHPHELAHCFFFFPERSKSCHSTDFFFCFPLGLKKKRKPTWLSVSDSFIDPYKRRGGRKRRKNEISSTAGTKTSCRSRTHLLNYGCGRVSRTGRAGNRRWCAFTISKTTGKKRWSPVGDFLWHKKGEMK